MFDPDRAARTSSCLALLLGCLLCVPATPGCDTALRRSERQFQFPDALMNADLGPRRVARNDWDPFGWAGEPDAGNDADQPATRYASAKPRPQVDASARPVASAAAPPRADVAPTSEPAPAPATRAPKTTPATPTTTTAAGPSALDAVPSAEHYDPAEAAGYVTAVYAVNGVDLGPAARSEGRAPTIVELYRHAYSKGIVYQSERPATGDLVFFHNTFDRNGDGRWNDWYTLVAVVESVDADGTVSALAYLEGRVSRVRLNVEHPELTSGNSALRADDTESNGRAGALFAGYANLLGDIPRVTVIDNWQPGMLTASR